MRLLVSAVALLVLPAAVCSCDLLKRKASGGGAGGAPPSLAFTPSNLDLTGMDLSKVGDFKVEDPSCTLSSDDLLASCGNGGDVLAFKLAKQADGSPIAVYVARSVHIAPHAVLTVRGKNPVAIVALDSIDIRGHLVAAAGGSLPGSGGHTGVTSASNKAGVGSGGGGAGTATASAGGGGYCGKGGAGALEVGKAGAAGHGGVAYGTPAISPLVGGSAGGTGDPGPGGGGGGAIELVAKTSITIATGGVIQVGGGGGGFGGMSGQGASGGGSGGSILLEAAIVTVAGTLAANGGGGGGTSSTGARFFGGGGIELLDPASVVTLGGDFRPGLVAFARELAGDWVCWDLRKGRPAAGSAPSVVYVDHELGLATPFARDVRGALVHVLARALVGLPVAEIAPFAAAWPGAFGPGVGPKGRAALARLSTRVSRGGKRPVFRTDDEARSALADLVPRGKADRSTLPLTTVPLLSPDDPRCIDEAIEASVAVYRQVVHDEGREVMPATSPPRCAGSRTCSCAAAGTRGRRSPPAMPSRTMSRSTRPVTNASRRSSRSRTTSSPQSRHERSAGLRPTNMPNAR